MDKYKRANFGKRFRFPGVEANNGRQTQAFRIRGEHQFNNNFASLFLNHEEQDADLLGIPFKGNNLVFSQSDGAPRRPDTLTKALPRYCRKVGLTGVRLHDLRHTHASLLLKLNANPKTVSDRLGHASIQITMDVYSHLLPGVQEAAVAGLDAMLEPAESVQVVQLLN